MSAEKKFSPKEYRRVREDKGDAVDKKTTPANDVRVTARRGNRFYVNYILGLFEGAEGKAKFDTVNISGMGAAVTSVVSVAEQVKRCVKGLHQTSAPGSINVTDKYEKIENNEVTSIDRVVPTVLICLSLKPLDTKAAGYQAPIAADLVVGIDKIREEEAAATAAAKAKAAEARKERQEAAAAAKAAAGADGEKKKSGERRRRGGAGRRRRGGEKKPAAEGAAAPAAAAADAAPKKEREPRKPKEDKKPAAEKKDEAPAAERGGRGGARGAARGGRGN